MLLAQSTFPSSPFLLDICGRHFESSGGGDLSETKVCLNDDVKEGKVRKVEREQMSQVWKFTKLVSECPLARSGSL